MASSNTVRTGNLNFFSLPPEMRRQIYKHHFANATTSISYTPKEFGPKLVSCESDSQLLKVSRVIRNEALEVGYDILKVLSTKPEVLAAAVFDLEDLDPGFESLDLSVPFSRFMLFMHHSFGDETILESISSEDTNSDLSPHEPLHQENKVLLGGLLYTRWSYLVERKLSLDAANPIPQGASLGPGAISPGFTDSN